ncbi:hypothetical protein BMJ35_17400 [Sinorhizobium medicae]|nr:hypothetical protein BMJ35_17400 [Sinorhizobium medicae]
MSGLLGATPAVVWSKKISIQRLSTHRGDHGKCPPAVDREKLQIIERSFEAGETVSSTARRHGVTPNLLYRWRRFLSTGGAAAVDSDEPIVGNSQVMKLEGRVRELERMLGRKTEQRDAF